jgi:cytochrome c-type protein NapC
MDFGVQTKAAAATHKEGFAAGKTCIDCHKGIAHTLPPIEQHIGAPKDEPAQMPAMVNPAASAASR